MLRSETQFDVSHIYLHTHSPLRELENTVRHAFYLYKVFKRIILTFYKQNATKWIMKNILANFPMLIQ